MTVPITTDHAFDPALRLSLIVESTHNPRKYYDEAKLEELAGTIRSRGIDNPVTVRAVGTPDGMRYELAAGHRRCRAARRAGLEFVPAFVRDLSDRDFLELMHTDNLHREDLNPLDEALAFQQLLDEGGYDLNSLCAKIGKSLTYVASRVRLLTLGTAAREALQRGYILLSHALELAKITETAQEQMLEHVFRLSSEKLRLAGEGVEQKSDGADGDEEEDQWDAQDDIDSAHFGEEAARHPFRLNYWATPTMATLDELKSEIKTEVFRRLSVVAWDLADAELLPQAGACSACPKRSGAAPLLFAELDTGSDTCLDGDCFDAKREAYEAQQRDARTRPGAAQGQHDDEDDEGGASVDPNADWAAKRKKEEKAAKLKREKQQRGREAVVSALIAAIPDDALQTVEWLAAIVRAALAEVHNEVLQRLLKRLGIVDKAPEKSYGFGYRTDLLEDWTREADRTQRDLLEALVFLMLGDETTIPTYGSDRADRIEDLAALTCVDVRAIAKAAEKEKPEKAPKPPKVDAKAVPAKRAARRMAGVQ